MIEIQGKAVVLGDHINTDLLAPGRWKLESMDVLKAHCLEGIVAYFSKKVMLGDILVAGEDFGCGSHREQAITVLQALGIQAILADSVSRLYYRNGIALGMPVLSVPGIRHRIHEGDFLQVKLSEMEIKVDNLTSEERLILPPLPREMLSILEDGGVLLSLKRALEKQD